MDIFIKTFNRPYYLDRCLFSIRKFTRGYDKIYVLDDGTPAKYMEKISNKYPEVIFFRSEFYSEKSRKIENYINHGLPVQDLKLPSKFWKDTIFKFAKTHFVLLEDDMWFNKSIDLNIIEAIMIEKKMSILKFFHFNNYRLISGKKINLTNNVVQIIPKLIITDPYMFKNIMIRNPLKIFSILTKIRLVDRFAKINYYTIYNVAGCVFDKKYYNYLWSDVNEKVDEDLQLIKAVEYNKKYSPGYGYTSEDVIQTSFSSSATNMFNDIDFNVFQYNYLLNEEWFADNFNSCNDLNADISDDVIRNILHKQDMVKISQWELWRKKFISQYELVGHKLD